MSTLADYKAAQRLRWASFAPFQALTVIPAGQLVRFSALTAGDQVLDVACGTGVVAVTAARRGASVTALDLTPELLEIARSNANTAAVAVDWHEGDVEALPFPGASFDVVLSQFGHMFAPRPEVALAEMLRVLRPGGTIAFSTWPPEMVVGRMFALTARYLPPAPEGVPPATLWGEPAVVTERLGAAVHTVRFARRGNGVPVLSPAHFREFSERNSGALVQMIETLSKGDPERLARFRAEHEALTHEFVSDNVLRQDYLMTRAIKA